MSDSSSTLQLGVMKAYMASNQNQLLVSNPDFGERKYFNVVAPGGGSDGKKTAKMSRQFGKKGGGKKWVHPQEALVRGHIAYNVKFLGFVEVESSKGTETVKEAIRKMKFNKQIKKAEGQKTPKVELTISVDGVTVQEPKYKVIQHQYPLHRISYCADDKSDKKMLTFIAKSENSDQHQCFVFHSDRSAEEITLTIGQAFDLAYKRFLEKSSKDIDLRKKFLLLQKKVQQLTQENLDLKARCADLERLLDPRQLEEFERNHKPSSDTAVSTNGESDKSVEVGRKLENLVFEDLQATAVYTPLPQSNGLPENRNIGGATEPIPMLSPPPPVPSRSNVSKSPVTFTEQSQPANGQSADMFGQPPFTQNPATTTTEASLSPGNPFSTPSQPAPKSAGDPFGMVKFTPTPQPSDLDTQIQNADKELMDLQTGFSRGLSFGTSDFTLDDLDPLKN